MRHRILISHSHIDKPLAEVISETIKTLSLGQITPWFSSDVSVNGGIRGGDLWMERLHQELNSCSLILSLVTPTSVQKPWLYFESGFGAAREDCDIIPICVGFDELNALPYPLAMYQSYSLQNYKSMSAFFEAMNHRFDLMYSAEMAKPILQPVFDQIMSITSKTSTDSSIKKPMLSEEVIEDLREMMQSELSSLKRDLWQTDNSTLHSYEIKFAVSLGELNTSIFVTVDHLMSFGELLDEIFYAISRYVPPFSYLHSWVITQDETPIIVYGSAKSIPASVICPPSSRNADSLKIIKLEQPLLAHQESSDHVDISSNHHLQEQSLEPSQDKQNPKNTTIRTVIGKERFIKVGGSLIQRIAQFMMRHVSLESLVTNFDQADHNIDLAININEKLEHLPSDPWRFGPQLRSRLQRTQDQDSIVEIGDLVTPELILALIKAEVKHLVIYNNVLLQDDEMLTRVIMRRAEVGEVRHWMISEEIVIGERIIVAKGDLLTANLLITLSKEKTLIALNLSEIEFD